MVRRIMIDNQILAIIIDANYKKEGIEFFTPGDFSQQLGYINHPSGHIIPPHTHNKVSREVTLTQEVIYINKGKVRVDFYNQDKFILKVR